MTEKSEKFTLKSIKSNFPGLIGNENAILDMKPPPNVSIHDQKPQNGVEDDFSSNVGTRVKPIDVYKESNGLKGHIGTESGFAPLRGWSNDAINVGGGDNISQTGNYNLNGVFTQQ